MMLCTVSSFIIEEIVQLAILHPSPHIQKNIFPPLKDELLLELY
jgi:hypothetical protein